MPEAPNGKQPPNHGAAKIRNARSGIRQYLGRRSINLGCVSTSRLPPIKQTTVLRPPLLSLLSPVWSSSEVAAKEGGRGCRRCNLRRSGGSADALKGGDEKGSSID